jgi:hypothetical protein
MIGLSPWQKRQLEMHRARLRRVQRGEMWGRDRPGPHSPEEKAAEIARIKALIAKAEKKGLSLSASIGASELQT